MNSDCSDICNTEKEIHSAPDQIHEDGDFESLGFDCIPLLYTVYYYDVETETCAHFINNVTLKNGKVFVDILNAYDTVSMSDTKRRRRAHRKTPSQSIRKRYYFLGRWMESYFKFESQHTIMKGVLLPIIHGIQKPIRRDHNGVQMIMTADIPKFADLEDQNIHIREVIRPDGTTSQIAFEREGTLPLAGGPYLYHSIPITNWTDSMDELHELVNYKSLKRVYNEIIKNNLGLYKTTFQNYKEFTSIIHSLSVYLKNKYFTDESCSDSLM